jgi:MFS superfamily sulfate permease-like transporter
VNGLFAGLLCYGLIGRSPFAIVTATSSSAAVLASATLALAGTDVAQRVALASLLVVGTGIAFLVCGALRLGAMSNLIARPVLRGYTFGLALVIAVKQWPLMVHLHPQSSGFFSLIAEMSREFRIWHVPTLACGIAALAGLFVLERLPRLPGALVVIVASIIAAPLLAAHGVALTGPIHLALAPPTFALAPGTRALVVIEFSVAVMFILYAESYGSIRTFALKHDDEVQPNRDLVALGVANLVSGLFHGTPVGAGYSASAANDAAGARSRLSGLSSAAVVAVLLLLFLGWIERIPEPVLAAIVINAVSKSLRLDVFRNYFRWHRDRLVVIAAALGVMVLGVLNGLLAAIAFSILRLLRRLATPGVSELGRVGEHDYLSLARFPGAVTSPVICVVRIDEPLFFANADPVMALVRERVLASPQAKLVVLSLEESPDLDSTSLEVLSEFCSWLAARGAELRLARLKESAREALRRANILQVPESALNYSSVDDAVRGKSVTPLAH